MRVKIKKSLIFFISSFCCLNGFSQNNDGSVLPTPQQVQWADAEIGVIIHFDMNTIAPNTYKYGHKETLPPLSAFHPSSLNTDQWVAAAKSAGAKYAVLVVKHGTGFSLWPTKVHNYNVGNTSWKNGKGDILADFLKSCKKYDVKPGIYFSVNSNTFLGINDKIQIDSAVRKCYNKLAIAQLKELWGTYGKFFEIWFDGGILPSSKGGFSDEVSAMVNKYQPQAILFQGPYSSKNLIRWVGNEDGNAPYPMWSRADSTTSANGTVKIKNLSGNPDGTIWCPAESDFPTRKNSSWEGGWFWRANQDENVLTVNDLIKNYYTTVGRNTNMLMGMAIDSSGRFPEKETMLFKAFGDSIREKFAHPLAETKGAGKEFILNLGKTPKLCSQVVLMEDITKGENIRSYILEAWVNNKWEKIGEGGSVGHKHIEVFPPVITSKLRLKITEAEGMPEVKLFAVYN